MLYSRLFSHNNLNKTNMKLLHKILHCPDENGWTNPNITRAEKLEKLADEHAIKFAEWLVIQYNEDTIYAEYNTKELLEIFKKSYENES